ncbi:MAG: hypothetical protein ABH889_03080 [Candidatus Portnoybacteria bacterium]
MKIGYDLDGVIFIRVLFYNPSIKLPWYLFLILIPLILVIPPKKEIVHRLKTLEKEGHEIVIISARPPQTIEITKRLMKFYGIPFSDIYCVGFGKGTKERKLEIIRKKGIEQFVDDNERVIDFLKKNGVDVLIG